MAISKYHLTNTKGEVIGRVRAISAAEAIYIAGVPANYTATAVAVG